MEKDTLGDKIRSQRIKKGYSQEHLAELSQLSLRTIQRIENDETEPRGDTLKRLTIPLETSIDELVKKPATDSGYLTAMNISGMACLSWAYIPFLGVLVPWIFWLVKKDILTDVRQEGKKILNFQLTWVIPFHLFYFGFFFFKINHFAYASTLMQVAIGILIFNVVLILINTARISYHREIKYWPAFKFLR